jgi:hypothetical protein
MEDGDHRGVAAARLERALTVAQLVTATRFARAACTFVCGSIIRGQGTPASDLDLVVVFKRLDRSWREAFVEGGFPIEAFVHDPETLAWFMEKDRESGYPITAHMVSTGRFIGDAGFAAEVRKQADALLAKGPRITGARLNELRYAVTDLLEDLRDDRSLAEKRAIAIALYQPLADLMLLGRGAWSGKGKWIPRLLETLSPDLAGRFDCAFHEALTGSAQPLIGFGEVELAAHGGPFFIGDRREAPASCRRTVEESLPR